MNNKAELLGYNIDTFDFESAVEYANSISGQVVTINPTQSGSCRSKACCHRPVAGVLLSLPLLPYMQSRSESSPYLYMFFASIKSYSACVPINRIKTVFIVNLTTTINL